MQKLLQLFSEFVLDICFPKKCLSCHQEGTWLCQACQNKIKMLDDHVCGICEKALTPFGQTCHACKRKKSLDALLPATSYRDSLVAQTVHLFKYRFIQELCEVLGRLLTKAISQSELPLPDLIVPVPLHKRRLRWRGFNQSALLAKFISANLLSENILTLDENILARTRYTSPQMEIKQFQERQKNICGAFIVIDAERVRDKTILLVDDVTTTGSTLFECAKVLKQAGAKYVWAVVVARQEISNSKTNID